MNDPATSADTSAAQAAQRICEITLDERTVLRRSALIEQERAAAIADLLKDNTFTPLSGRGGPFNLHLAIKENRLVIDIRTLGDDASEIIMLPVDPFRRIVKDYFLICESYYNAIRGKMRAISEHLSDLGFEPTLDPGTPLMFHVAPGQPRVALADDEGFDDAARLSPGVLLRPLWQDAVLPSIGFVVGPGELQYLAVVAGLYKLLGVPRPVLVPRASLTLMEPSLRKHLDRFGWDLPDLAAGAEVLGAKIGDESSSIAERELEALVAEVGTRFSAADADLRESDQAMVGPLDRARSKVADEIDKLLNKLRNSRQNRQGTGMRQVRRLCANLRPRGRPQERVLPILPFLVTHGRSLGATIVEAADPFGVQHGVLEL